MSHVYTYPCPTQVTKSNTSQLRQVRSACRVRVRVRDGCENGQNFCVGNVLAPLPPSLIVLCSDAPLEAQACLQRFPYYARHHGSCGGCFKSFVWGSRDTCMDTSSEPALHTASPSIVCLPLMCDPLITQLAHLQCDPLVQRGPTAHHSEPLSA